MYQTVKIVYGIATTRAELEAKHVQFENEEWTVMDYVAEFEGYCTEKYQNELPDDFRAVRQDDADWIILGTVIASELDVADRITAPGALPVPRESDMGITTRETLQRLGFDNPDLRFYVTVTW